MRMTVARDDFGLIRVQFHEPGGTYRSAVWLTPIEAAVLVELLAPILRAEAAKLPLPAAKDPVVPTPVGDQAVRDALNLDNWTEQRGFGSDEGAKCPHCHLTIKPHELPASPGELACPACLRPFVWTCFRVGDTVTYSTLTLIANP